MKNPFMVFHEFISPLQCEDIIIGNNNIFPQVDKDGNIKPLFFGNTLSEIRILPKLKEEIIPSVESHYDVDIKGIKPFQFEWFPEGYKGDKTTYVCENSIMINEKWERSNNNDFAAILFLNEYNDNPAFDSDFEVYGGQLEFLTHGFSFNPRRGTLIIFPGAPNFINNTATVTVGELNQIRIHFAAHELFVYDMNKFLGNYKVWFKGEKI